MFNALFLSALLLLTSAQSVAGLLNKTEIENLLEGRYLVGDIQADIPAYPLFLKNPSAPSAKPELAGYAFETIDL
ncbi:MAG: hypothetical protein NT095_10720 [Burkholderiales bacterium]|nr:hypothetical protein [Burkholderiales bacterium]